MASNTFDINLVVFKNYYMIYQSKAKQKQSSNWVQAEASMPIK